LSWSPLRVDNPEVLKDLEYDCEKIAKILRVVIEESTPKCPKCGKPFEVVALSTKYVIEGCSEHREFDRVREL